MERFLEGMNEIPVLLQTHNIKVNITTLSISDNGHTCQG